MKKIASLLLAGAVIVTAQTSAPQQVTIQDREQLSIQLQDKLLRALNKGGENAERARNAAMEFQKQMKGKSPEEAEKAVEEYKAQIQERLQNAIAALEQASSRVGAQVDQVRERIQSRLQEKKGEIVKLQERNHTRK